MMEKNLVNVPEKLKWNNQVYYFVCNKVKTLLYSTGNERDGYMDNDNTEVIIIEHRKYMNPYDQFYVLYYINSYNVGEGTGINVNKIDSIGRLAQAI